MRFTTACAVQVSVIVCTCNRRRRLETTLDSFERLDVPTGVSWELIVVDNNSTDGTDSMIAGFKQRCTLPLMPLVERRRGKLIALNTAIQHARGAIIAFTDDDCVVDPSWLRTVVREFEADPSLAAWAGEWNCMTAPITSSAPGLSSTSSSIDLSNAWR